MYDVFGDTLIIPGDTINTLFRVSSWGDCGSSGYCNSSDFQWFRNGIALVGDTNYTYTATDTGLYRVEFISDCLGFKSKSFHISYQGGFTQTNELIRENSSPFVYHAGSSIYRINMTDKKLKQLLLSDNSGRLVLSTINTFSEIDLGTFSPGIYYYTIYDEDKNAWRGKIVKQ